jgi:putative ABC transport system substrate-binding protein
MKRRDMLSGLASVMSAASLPAFAQNAERLRRVGALFPLAETEPEQIARRAGLQQGLEKLGWTSGRNLQIDSRFAGHPDRFAALAKELVALQPEVIFAQTPGAVAAVQRETQTIPQTIPQIPIVFANVSDPIGAGFVASLARPGGTITGLQLFEAGIAGKWLSMLREMSPVLKRAVLIGNPKTTAYDYFLRSAETAASSLAIAITPGRVESSGDIEHAVQSVAQGTGGGLVIASDSTNLRNRDLIIALATRHRLPAVYPERAYFEAGGLMSYGIADPVEPFRQAASYIDRILRGEKPADLPVQVPTKYLTSINLKTARAQGITVPPGLLLAADEVIE